MSATSPGVTMGMGGGYSPEVFHQMSKRITQLTKVIFALNNRIEVQDNALHAMKDQYENSLKECVVAAECKTRQKREDAELRLTSHFQLLERQLGLEKERNEALMREHQYLREQLGHAHKGRIASLYRELKETKSDFERKLDEFENLHNEMMYSPTPTQGGTLERPHGGIRFPPELYASTAKELGISEEQLYELYWRKNTTDDLKNVLSNIPENSQCLPEDFTALLKQGPMSVTDLIARFSSRGTDSGSMSDIDAHRSDDASVVSKTTQKEKTKTLPSKGSVVSREVELAKLRDKISMLEATKTEQEIVINKLQTDVVKLKEKVKHLLKLRQELLEQRGADEDKIRTLKKERDKEVSLRDARLRELEEELEQYECKMEYLEHTQVHLQRSLLASENKAPKLLEQLEETSRELEDCKDELIIKTKQIEHLSSSVISKEALIEKLQNDLRQFKKETNEEMERRFLMYMEEKEQLLVQMQEETGEYVKAAFAEKDGQLRELNEKWQLKYDSLNNELESLRKALDEANQEKQSLIDAQAAAQASSSSSDEDNGDDDDVSASGSTVESSVSVSQDSHDEMIEYHVEMRVQRHREELQRLHEINEIELRSKYEEQTREVREKLENRIMKLKKHHEEELMEFDQLLNDELNRVHKKYQVEIRRLREQVMNVRGYQDEVDNKCDKGIQAFVPNSSFDTISSRRNSIEEAGALKEQLSEIQDLLLIKENEIMKVRTEASNQIRNIEHYWQERLSKELKELLMDRDRELDETKQNYNKQIKLLNDKINSLQTIMKLTGQGESVTISSSPVISNSPIISPVVEEPSTDEEEDEDDDDGDDGDMVEYDEEELSTEEGSFEELEEDEEIIEEIVEIVEEVTVCPQGAATPLKHNPLVKSASASLEEASSEIIFPRSLLKKSSSSDDCDGRIPKRCKKVSFADFATGGPKMHRYNPEICCMEILKPLEEQFRPKKKRAVPRTAQQKRPAKKTTTIDFTQEQTSF